MLALADIPLEAGPTQLVPGSQRLTNHHARTWIDHDDLVYQTSREITPADILGDPGYEAPLPEPMAAGEVLFFDDRLLHRGLGNSSTAERWIAYFAYLRPRPGLDAVADTHFEASRSLFA
jgi:ectoine hydroxylase-related dioxygenase (phytanoyl-CoA dioxygenase family)